VRPQESEIREMGRAVCVSTGCDVRDLRINKYQVLFMKIEEFIARELL